MSSVLADWRLRDIETKADRALGRLYEMDSLRSDVARLERANGEIRAEASGLRFELQAALDRIQRLEELADTPT